jgi:hypothetical protein
MFLFGSKPSSTPEAMSTDESNMTVDTFEPNTERRVVLEAYPSKVVEALEKYKSLPKDKKSEIFEEALRLRKITREWFGVEKEQSKTLIAPDNEALIQKFHKMPTSVQVFMNALQRERGEPIFYFDNENEDRNADIPKDVVVIPIVNNCGHNYDLGIPYLSSGETQMLYRWGSTVKMGNHCTGRKKELRIPTMEEIVALVTARKQ